MRFPLHDETTAPDAARPALEATRKNFGMIPNLERVMASAPALLQGYSQTWDLFDETSLTPVERQVVYLTANYENDCTYCVPWHSLLARKAKMPGEVIEALRSGAVLPDARLEALRGFTRSLIANRGKISQAERQAFFDAGYSETQALEVVLGLAVKLMSNYTNSIAGTPLDDAVQKLAWRKPTIPMRAP
ncbi:carboxymuconolactone decarboxylase family protein [Denitrobaculum tricleocarpae]|uniref:Carboxymuconolactone decarboxylase family protein n=1 Tax=Denitrobaculum tricleocarpae TaxID=2591009 RepID=A0A545U2W1_9PROT|nr:carboxymuconolactone decarboxylase family protein [Denitrobaculum tricleocarpae]TQV83788.1 carboxymuconolactone decarboxylase family protein [Denitrobaculum tricleocarpae]